MAIPNIFDRKIDFLFDQNSNYFRYFLIIFDRNSRKYLSKVPNIFYPNIFDRNMTFKNYFRSTFELIMTKNRNSDYFRQIPHILG